MEVPAALRRPGSILALAVVVLGAWAILFVQVVVNPALSDEDDSDTPTATATVATQATGESLARATFPPANVFVATETAPDHAGDPVDDDDVIVPFAGGSARGEIPAGTEDQLAVVAMGSRQGHVLPIVVRNNTVTTVADLVATVTVRGADDTEIETASSIQLKPRLISPGSLAVGWTYLEREMEGLPENATIDVELSPGSADASSSGSLDLVVTEASVINQDRIVGFARNPHDQSMRSGASVEVYCLDDTGALSFSDGSAPLAATAGATVPFQVTLRTGAGDCSAFLTVASGLPPRDIASPTARVAATGEDAAPLLGGTGKDVLPRGESGRLSIIAAGDLNDYFVPVVVRNNTREAVAGINVVMTVFDPDGALFAVAASGGLDPLIVPPGGIAIGALQLTISEHIPPNASIQYDVAADAAAWSVADYRINAEIIDATQAGGLVRGELRNPGPFAVDDGFYVNVVCLDAAGAATWYTIAQMELAAESGETTPFEIELLEASRCDHILVAAWGYRE
ncbi:MAG: hypothetical protein ACRDJH_24535 [Thermomicrobiales bacterium]